MGLGRIFGSDTSKTSKRYFTYRSQLPQVWEGTLFNCVIIFVFYINKCIFNSFNSRPFHLFFPWCSLADPFQSLACRNEVWMFRIKLFICREWADGSTCTSMLIMLVIVLWGLCGWFDILSRLSWGSFVHASPLNSYPHPPK